MPTIADLEHELNQNTKAPPVEAVLAKFRFDGVDALAKKTGRNVIAYYSAFMTRRVQGIDISDTDINAFMNVVNGMDRKKGLDLVLHTPGGGITATEHLVHYLRDLFGTDIRCIVPQAAFSAGTMIACATREILMGRQSCLGPIDPQFNGFPCHGIIEEFKEAVSQIRNDPSYIAVWRPVIEQYKPTFLGECQKAIEMSNEFVGDWLRTGMFAGDPHAKAKAKKIVDKLGNHAYTKTHDRHIPAGEAEKLGLKIKRIEDDQDLQEKVLTLHHAFMLTFERTKLVKIVLGDNGRQYLAGG